MKKLMFILLNLVLISCDKETPENNVIVDTLNWIILKNESGENLLDPNVPNHYENNKIYVYKLDSVGKEVVLQNNKVMSLPEMAYFISMVEYGIEDAKVNQTTVYLKLSPSEIDTINVEYKMENGNLYTTKLWYNEELKWTRENDIPIVIIKD